MHVAQRVIAILLSSNTSLSQMLYKHLAYTNEEFIIDGCNGNLRGDL